MIDTATYNEAHQALEHCIESSEIKDIVDDVKSSGGYRKQFDEKTKTFQNGDRRFIDLCILARRKDQEITRELQKDIVHIRTKRTPWLIKGMGLEERCLVKNWANAAENSFYCTREEAEELATSFVMEYRRQKSIRASNGSTL